MKDLDGKVVIITGAGGGIGRTTAIEFAKNNAKVVIAGRNEEKHNQTIDLIKADGGTAIYIKTDVTQADQVDALVKQTVKRFGQLDCAFNNAGTFGKPGLMHTNTEENFSHVFDVNVKGIWLCMKYQIPEMLKTGKGTIVNCSSVAGLIGYAPNCEYTASKHAVVGLSKSTALLYAGKGLRINTVCPGPIDTEMLRLAYDTPEKLKKREEVVPMNRIGKPKEISETVLWLCSDASSFITGQVISVDGGIMAGK